MVLLQLSSFIFQNPSIVSKARTYCSPPIIFVRCYGRNFFSEMVENLLNSLQQKVVEAKPIDIFKAEIFLISTGARSYGEKGGEWVKRER